MTRAAKELLDTLDSLPEAERDEVYREVLRRAALSEYDAPTEADVVSAANEVFLDLERTESGE